jgi:4-amino-4-deoxy-L-arabinose transferase-like glycosyltransferase
VNDPDLPSGLALFFIFAMLGYFLVTLTRNHRQSLQLQAKLFICALAVRFAVSIVVYQFGLVSVIGDEDASGWAAGIGIYQEWVRKGIGLFELPNALAGAFDGHHKGYYFLTGALFFFSGTAARLPAAALNCLFGALTVVFAFRIARSLFSSDVAVRVGWWTCFFPSMIIWSSQTLKEPIVIMLETVALYGCVRLKVSGFSLRHILLCAATIVLLIPFRFYASYIVGAAVVLALVLPQLTRRRFTIGSAVSVAGLVVPILVLSGVLAQHEAQFEQFDLNRIQKFRKDVAEGSGSGVESDYDLNTTSGLLAGTTVGGAHLMLAPFPWQLGVSLRAVLTLPELVVWWWLFFIGVVPGLIYAIRNRFNDIQPILFFILSLGLLYSMMFGNVGLVFRQRAQLLPWLLIFAAVGIEQRLLKRLRARRPIHPGFVRPFPQMPQPLPSTKGVVNNGT